MCGIFFGGVFNSSVLHERELGKSGLWAKTAPLSPTCLEWLRAFNFCSHLLDFTFMRVPAWDGCIGFMTRTRKTGTSYTICQSYICLTAVDKLDEGGPADANRRNPFLATTPKSSKTTQGVNPVDYHHVRGDRTKELNNKLRDILSKNGLACTDDGEFPAIDNISTCLLTSICTQCPCTT